MYDVVYTEIYSKLSGILTTGSLWARGEYNNGCELLRQHFTVLDTNADVGNTKILMHDGEHVGQIISLEELEKSRLISRCTIVSYWHVPDDQIDRVHFGS
jgi:hypothetical protein